MTKTEEDHYTVTFHATDLKEHENQYNQKGYWVGVQVTNFSENVEGWVLDYQGKKVDFEDSKYILHSWDSGEKRDFSALYLKADKHDGYVAGIQLLDAPSAEGHVLKTVYITFDMSGVEIYEEPIPEPGTGDDAGNDEGPSQQTPSDEGSDTQE